MTPRVTHNLAVTHDLPFRRQNETHRVPVRVQKILEAKTRQTRARPDDENPGVVHNVLTHFDRGVQFTRNVWRAERL